MIHFTPIQELGASNSCYSLRNQLALNPLFGDISFDDVQNFVKRWQTEFGVLSICDVVWNHTSFDSPWLKEHPECAYNVKNSPHLRPAYVLDRILWHTTLDVIAGKWEHMGVSKIIDKEDHLAVSMLVHVLVGISSSKTFDRIYCMVGFRAILWLQNHFN